MKILITGAAGFIGYNFTERIISNGDSIRLCDINFYKNMYELENVELIKGDLNDYEFCQEIVKDIDIIYHFVGTGHGKLMPQKKPDLLDLSDFNNNVNSTINLYNACVRGKTVKKIVQMSSVAVYGNYEYATCESLTPVPCSAYAVSKLCLEYYAHIYHELYGLNIVSLRLFNVYGFNENIEPEKSNIVQRFIYLISNNKMPMVYGKTTKRDYVYIDDVIEVILRVGNDDYIKNEVINVGTGTATTLDELTEKINQHLGTCVKVGKLNREYYNIPEYSLATTDHCYSLLGYKCKTDIDSGIQKIIELMK